MSKKKNTDLDDFGLDDFDEWDGDYSGTPPKDDRKPVTKMGSGIFKGIVEEAKTPSFYKSILKDALPKEYGSVWDSVDDVTSEGVGLYNELKKEIRPATRQMKRFMRYVKPKVEPVMPKWFSKRLDHLIEDDSRPSTPTLSQEQIDESKIATELGEIFKAQTEAQTEDRARDTMRDLVDTKRHSATLESSSAIQSNLAQLVAYQDTVTNAFQRKSLELGYRSYFAQRDMLKIATDSTGKTLELLQNIAKNTGLPEFVKLSSSEAVKQQFRDALTGKIQQSMTSGFRPFVSQFFNNLKTAGQTGIRNFVGNVQTAVDLKEQFEQMQQMAVDGGEDSTEATGKMVGGVLSQSLAGMVGSKLRPYLAKNEKLVGRGHQLARLRSSIPNKVRKWAQSPTENFGLWGSIVDAVKQAVPTQGRNREVAQSNISDLMGPSMFTNKAHLTLVDIIPGLLSRILQSSEGIRTGELPELTRWDYEGRGFIGESALTRKIASKIFKKDDLENREWQSNSFLEYFDEKAFTPEQQKALKSYLQQRVTEKSEFDPLDFIKAGNFAKYTTDENAAAIAKQFLTSLDLDEKGETKIGSVAAQKRHTSLDTLYRNMATTENGAQANATLYYNLGYQDIVRKLGILENDKGRESLKESSVNEFQRNYRDKDQDYEKVLDTLLAKRSVDDSFDNSRHGGLSNVGPGSSPIPAAAASPSVDSEVVASGIFHKLKTWMLGADNAPGTTSTQQQSVASGNMELDAHIDRVVTAIEAASSRETSVSMLQTLNDILAAVMNIGVEGNGGGTGDGKPIGKPKGGFFSRAAKLGWRGAKRAGSAGWRASKFSARSAWGLAKLPLKAIKWAGSALFGKVMDIKIPGKQDPALTAEGMRAGIYFDAVTKKVIKSINDIKGAVVKIVDGKEETVLTLEQFKAGLYDSAWKPIKTGAAKLFDTALGLGGKAVSLAFAPARGMYNVLKSIKDKVLAAPDIFVPGETSPRIIGKLLDGGQTYFDTAGKPLSSVGEIKTDVFHKDQSDKPVLYYSEFVKGVVDYKGNPVRSNGDRALGVLSAPFKLAGKALGAAKRGAGWLLDKAGGALSGLFGGIKGGFGGLGGGIFGPGRASTHYQIENINVLKAIYNLLCSKYGMGDPMEPTPSDGSDGPKGPGIKGVFAGVKKGFKDGLKKWRRTKRIRDNLKTKAKEFKDAKIAEGKAKLAEHGFDDEKLGQYRANIDVTVASLREKRAKTAQAIKDKIGMEDTVGNTVKGIRGRVMRRMASDRKEKGEGYGNLDKLKSLYGSLKDQTKTSKPYTSIRDRIKDRLASDSTRANSYASVMAARKVKQAEKANPAFTGPHRPDVKEGNGLMMPLMGIVSTLSGIWSTVKGIGAALVAAKGAGAAADALGELGDGPDGDKTKKKPKGKAGLLKRLGRGAMGVGRGLLSAGGWALRGGIWAAGAIASVVSVPVVLGAVAVGALAVAGYYTYKYFKGQIGLLNQLRMAQYGVSLEDKDACTRVAELERLLAKKVVWEGNKPVRISIDKSEGNKILEVMGCDTSNPVNVKALSDWYEGRFKPVFLSNLAALKIHDAACELLDVDSKLVEATKYAYAQKTMSSTGFMGPYYVYAKNIFPDSEIQRGTSVIEGLLEKIKLTSDPKATTKTNQIGNVPTKDTRSAEEKNIEMMRKRSESQKAMSTNTGLKSQAEAYVLKNQADAAAKKAFTPNSPLLPPNVPVAPPKSVQDTVQEAITQVGDTGNGEGGIYRNIPVPTGDGYVRVQPTISAAANAVGFDEKIALSVAGVESSYRIGVQSRDKNGKIASSAVGLFQFTKDTWKEQMGKHAEKYGIPKNATPDDPVANSLLGAEYLKSNKAYLERTTGKSVGDTELYAAHFFGAGGATKFLNADRNASAAMVMPAASAANQAIFFDGARQRTVDEVYQILNAKVSGATGQVASRKSAGVSPSASVKVKPQAEDTAVAMAAPERGNPRNTTAEAVQAASATRAPAPQQPSRPTAPSRLAAIDQREELRRNQAASQQTLSSTAMAETVQQVHSVLTESLSVQKSMAASLDKMVAALSGVAPPSKPNSARQPSDAPKPAVSMARNV